MSSGMRWAGLTEVLELTKIFLRARETAPEERVATEARFAEVMVSIARSSTIQELVQGILEVQKGRMTLQLALFAAAATLTAAAFERENAALFLVAGAVVPLAFLSDLITKRNTLSPLLYKLGRLEVESGDTEPFALLFAAASPAGARRLRSLLSGEHDGDCRVRFRRYFLLRALPFALFFYGFILTIELALAYAFREWMPVLRDLA